jgi:uncharacterized protein YabN with tetrapyrrole methylase and pyrophosphatase domain
VDAGSLTVVGTGFGVGGAQVTADAASVIASSEKVLYLVPDVETADWIHAANPTSESLGDFYLGRAGRLETYLDITEHILSFVRRGLRVCAAFYGHPGVFVFPSHEAIIRAGEEGFAARMLPGVSAEDCLFADLGVDPGRRGCRIFDATDFLVRRHPPDVTVPLILWQVGAVGRTDYPHDDNRANLAILAEVLLMQYGRGHEVVIYEAAFGPRREPVIEFIWLEQLVEAPIGLISTLYIPPRDEAMVDEQMVARLGMPEIFSPQRMAAASRYRPSRPQLQSKSPPSAPR